MQSRSLFLSRVIGYDARGGTVHYVRGYIGGTYLSCILNRKFTGAVNRFCIMRDVLHHV